MAARTSRDNCFQPSADKRPADPARARFRLLGVLDAEPAYVRRLEDPVRRRERVIRIFPNDESALRLIGALLAEQNETWLERRYLDMQEYHEWAAACAAAREGNNVVALSG